MITKKDILHYIAENINIEEPGTCDTISIWNGPNGLTHTTGSMEYRDKRHEHLITFNLYNEYAPYTENDIAEIIEFNQ